jgi:hypothetical protein
LADSRRAAFFKGNELGRLHRDVTAGVLHPPNAYLIDDAIGEAALGAA